MPKAKTKKKKFIDSKNEQTQTFSIIHRSQKDPLAADSDAPQRVLQALPSKDEIKKRKEEEREFGVFYDDEYDYLQHMKSRDEIQYDWDEVDKITIEAPDNASTRPGSTRPGSTKPGKPSNIKLPDAVFASTQEEEEIGLLNRAAPHKGPLFDWDPDIVETLDDEFKHETVYTFKDENMEEEGEDEMDLDDILKEAILEKEYESDAEDEDSDNDEYESYDSDEALDDVPSLEGGFSNFSDEETKSKFTSYSMSSSVIRRNDQLSLLDDKFEKFFDDYDEENVGGCEMDELQGIQSENSDIMKLMVAQHEKEKELKRQPHDVALRKEAVIDEANISSDDEKDLIETEDTRNPYDNFDCESILTTYSTLYNHPKLISEPSIKPIRVSGKTGIPKDVLGKGLTSAALKQLDMENERFEQKTRHDDVETMTLASRVSELSFRNKHESIEEKKARKQAVKEFRKERREEKKANRDAFKAETKMQSRNAINLKKNHNQAIKLV